MERIMLLSYAYDGVQRHIEEVKEINERNRINLPFDDLVRERNEIVKERMALSTDETDLKFWKSLLRD